MLWFVTGTLERLCRCCLPLPKEGILSTLNIAGYNTIKGEFGKTNGIVSSLGDETSSGS